MPKHDPHEEAARNARALAKAGDWDGAVQTYEALLAVAPDSAAVRAAYGEMLAKRHALEAEEHLRRAAELEPESVKYRLVLARFLAASAGRLEEAAALLDGILAEDPENAKALRTLATVREGLDDVDGSFAVHRRLLELTSDGEAYQAFAEFLNRQSRLAAHHAVELDPASGGFAATHAMALARSGEFADAAAEFQRAAELGTPYVDLRRDLQVVHHMSKGTLLQPLRPAAWPTRHHQFDDYEKLIRRYVLSELPIDLRLLTRSTRVATMGSCFATHIAERLQNRGINCFYKLIAEDVNSTYANRYLLDWVADGAADDVTTQFDALYGEEERLDFHRNLSACELFIFSLGVVTSFFDRESGQFVLQKGEGKGKGLAEGATLAELYVHRSTTLAENVANVRRTIDRLRTLNPGVKVVLTVSPVPLEGTYERRSAVLADCVSKSTLRLAAEEILRDGDPDIYYWPSFEMVRWLGAHLAGQSGPPPFAADDGRTRHVSAWLQELIVDLFIEHFGDDDVAGLLEAQRLREGPETDRRPVETLRSDLTSTG